VDPSKRNKFDEHSNVGGRKKWFRWMKKGMGADYLI